MSTCLEEEVGLLDAGKPRQASGGAAARRQEARPGGFKHPMNSALTGIWMNSAEYQRRFWSAWTSNQGS